MGVGHGANGDGDGTEMIQSVILVFIAVVIVGALLVVVFKVFFFVCAYVLTLVMRLVSF